MALTEAQLAAVTEKLKDEYYYIDIDINHREPDEYEKLVRFIDVAIDEVTSDE